MAYWHRYGIQIVRDEIIDRTIQRRLGRVSFHNAGYNYGRQVSYTLDDGVLTFYENGKDPGVTIRDGHVIWRNDIECLVAPRVERCTTNIVILDDGQARFTGQRHAVVAVLGRKPDVRITDEAVADLQAWLTTMSKALPDWFGKVKVTKDGQTDEWVEPLERGFCAVDLGGEGRGG